MKRVTTAILIISLITLLGAVRAFAQSRVHDVEASGIFTSTTVQSAGTGSLRIRTDNLVGSTDTVLHVFNLDTRNQIGFDDNSGPGRGSEVVIAEARESRKLLIVARGKNARRGGIADVHIGTRVHSSVAVAGAPVSLPCTEVGDVHVVTAPGGPLDTLVIGLNQRGRMIGWDDDSGVGQNSHLIGTRTCTAWIGIPPSEEAGPVRVYANDRSLDGDGDGLGRLLEFELGTCDGFEKVRGCDASRILQDRDRDGLEDGIEVLGYQDESAAPQYLPAWGANPLHKDMFVEVDREQGIPAPDPVAMLVPVRDWYAAGPASDLRNPSGLPGINLHFDIGVEPTDPQYNTLYGDWGGDTRGIAQGLGYQASSTANMATTRVGHFRYALHQTGGGGQNAGWRLGYSGSSRTLAHELGHSVGLQHWGHASWGDANCKPNYPSIMNYAFDNWGVGFSTGNLAEFPTNPSRTLEHLPESSEMHALGELRFHYALLESKPFEFETNMDDGEIDWNRDGLISETGTPVRAGISWANDGCRALDKSRKELTSGDNIRATATAITRVGQRLYAFHVETDGVLYVQHGEHTGIRDGGCFDDSPSGECMSWSDPEAVPIAFPVLDMDVITWQDSDIVIAYRTDQGVLRRVTAATEDDLISGWSRDRRLGGESDREPELFLLHTDEGVRLSAAWVETDTLGTFFRERSTTTPRWVWDNPSWLEIENGGRVDATASPTIVTIPGPDPVSCGVFPSTGGAVEFLCRDGESRQWTAHEAFQGRGRNLTNWGEKMGLAWHVARHADGTPVSGPERGSLHLSAIRVKNANSIPMMWVSQAFDSESMDLNELTFHWTGELGGNWTYLMPETGVTLFEDEGIGGLKGAWLRQNGGTPRFEFLPLADGAYDQDLKDGNDFRVMERRLCNVLRGSRFCGGPETSPWGY